MFEATRARAYFKKRRVRTVNSICISGESRYYARDAVRDVFVRLPIFLPGVEILPPSLSSRTTKFTP